MIFFSSLLYNDFNLCWNTVCEHLPLVTWSHGYVIMGLLDWIMSPDWAEGLFFLFFCGAVRIAGSVPGWQAKVERDQRWIRLLQHNPCITHAAKIWDDFNGHSPQGCWNSALCKDFHRVARHSSERGREVFCLIRFSNFLFIGRKNKWISLLKLCYSIEILKIRSLKLRFYLIFNVLPVLGTSLNNFNLKRWWNLNSAMS